MDTPAVDALARETSFSGVIRVDLDGETVCAEAYGLAHRAHGIANALETQFAIASGVKGLTALTVASLIEDGVLAMSTTARSLLHDDLPLIADEVTVEQLLAHRSGIGDYVDEDADLDINDYLMRVPVHELATTEDYLPALAGHEHKFAPGTNFSYCNGGYVVLALLAERASGVPFHDLVRDRVCIPAGMQDTEFLRSDELPARAALGYLAGSARTNVLHLPVRGSGDGGIYSTVADFSSFWEALVDGRIVSKEMVVELVRPHSDVPPSRRYGLGFWLGAENDTIALEGYDAGVSFRSVHDPLRRITHTVISNTSDAAWPLTRLLTEQLAT
jgi:CubicO group peptidase (beta-lactamase class C family)